MVIIKFCKEINFDGEAPSFKDKNPLGKFTT